MAMTIDTLFFEIAMMNVTHGRKEQNGRCRLLERTVPTLFFYNPQIMAGNTLISPCSLRR